MNNRYLCISNNVTFIVEADSLHLKIIEQCNYVVLVRTEDIIKSKGCIPHFYQAVSSFSVHLDGPLGRPNRKYYSLEEVVHGLISV